MKEFILKFKNSPMWVKVFVVLACAVLALMSLFACGPVQKTSVVVKDTPTGVTISTSQSGQDSSGTTISVTPNINFSPSGSAPH